MSLLDKLEAVASLKNSVNGKAGNPLQICLEKVLSPTEAIINGRKCILAGTNNYLGLTFDDTVVDAVLEGVRAEGSGTTGSRVANGTYAGHRALESDIAGFMRRRQAIVFTTGHQTNLGVLAGLCGKDDTILIDADCHASIYDGCALSAATVLRFRHNDAADLERRLKRLADPSRALIVTEGLFSMVGDRAPLKDIVAVKEKYGAYLMVDEAHSLGVLGEEGRGLGEETGTEDSIDFITGTFSKSAAAIGGFCVSNHAALDTLRFASRSYLFTASLPPGVIAGVRAALSRMRNDPSLKQRLWRNAQAIYGGLSDLGYRLGPELSPVMGVHCDSPQEAVRVWGRLLDNGIYVNLALPPATPSGESLLRISANAAHSPAQVDRILNGFKAARLSVVEGEAGKSRYRETAPRSAAG